MNDWTSGYVSQIDYTHGYYLELNPLRVALAFLNSGLSVPENGTACDLGFGQGLSLNLHAAASLTEWHGNDFNPSHAAQAQHLAEVSGARARISDASFADYCTRPDLPDFDYIGVHGIWSWISEENRAVIVDFVRRKLKPGGVLYISYNTMPGWAAMVPMRHLLTEHAKVMGSPGRGMVSQINAALEFSDKLLATNPVYARANPLIGDRMKKVKEQNRHYLAHEYFNRDWFPTHFSDLARTLSAAKVTYACSAHYHDHITGLTYTPEQFALIKEIPDAVFREEVRDMMMGQTFRRDYWVKGARPSPIVDRMEAMRAHRVVLTAPRASIKLKVATSNGEATMQEAVYGPVLDLLADHKPRTLGEIDQVVSARGVKLSQIIEVAMVLAGRGELASAQADAVVKKAKGHTDRLNAHLILAARGSGDISHLASPVTGGGIPVNRIQQLFLLSRAQGRKLPAEWAELAWQVVASQGQKIVKEGKPLETPEENQAEIALQVKEFNEERLPLLKALQVA